MRILFIFIFFYFCFLYSYAQPPGAIQECPKVSGYKNMSSAGVKYQIGVYRSNELQGMDKYWANTNINYSGYSGETYYVSSDGYYRYIFIWIRYIDTGKGAWYVFDGNNGKGWLFSGSSLPNGACTTAGFSGGIKLWVKNPDNTGRWTSSEVLFKFYEE